MGHTTETFAVVARMLPNTHRDSAYLQYKNIVSTLSTNRRLLEIGAGRRPLWTSTEIKQCNIDYVANDIAETELDRIPFPVKKAVFDCCGELPRVFFNSFDVICSKMVQEHVKSGDNFYCNIFRLLKPGAVAINFHPTLYCPPFLFNRILSGNVSSFILGILTGERTDETIPKFTATYELCYSSHRTAELIKNIGFSKVSIFPFYHHEYFKKIPLLRIFDDAISTWAQTRDVRLLSSYAYTVVKK
jgi:2-polyprenyl-3-methyl-5-hydroxy-6-metoxy-1,4-benzoquinol methylase